MKEAIYVSLMVPSSVACHDSVAFAAIPITAEMSHTDQKVQMQERSLFVFENFLEM